MNRAWVDQEHRREARAFEPFENRMGAIEEACNPVADSGARHDQINVAVERMAPHRLLQTTGVNIHRDVDAFRVQNLAGGSYFSLCSLQVLFPRVIVS